jgi:hypothetical protein
MGWGLAKRQGRCGAEKGGTGKPAKHSKCHSKCQPFLPLPPRAKEQAARQILCRSSAGARSPKCLCSRDLGSGSGLAGSLRSRSARRTAHPAPRQPSTTRGKPVAPPPATVEPRTKDLGRPRIGGAACKSALSVDKSVALLAQRLRRSTFPICRPAKRNCRPTNPLRQ